jgi:hypothetical protein
MVSNHWNAPHFNPQTESLTTHSDFIVVIDIGFDSIASLMPATREKCEDQFNSMTLDLKHVKERWEPSGQGDRVFTGSDDEKRDAMDNMANFVVYHQSYFQYLCHILEKYDLMSSLMQHLTKFIASSNGADGIPSIMNYSENESEVSLSENGSVTKSKKAKFTASQVIIRDGFHK